MGFFVLFHCSFLAIASGKTLAIYISLWHLSSFTSFQSCLKVYGAQRTGPSFAMFLRCDLHIRPQGLNLDSKYSLLWSSFCYFLFSIPSFFPHSSFFEHLGFLIFFPFFFQAFHWWKHFPTFTLLKKIEEQSVQITVCFTHGMEQIPPQAVLQEALKPPNAWELFKAQREGQGYSPLQPMPMLRNACSGN